MAISRVTQSMMTERSLSSLQTSLGRLAGIQERISTGRELNRPSDSPTGTTAAMRLRSALADQQQYARNAEDGLGWLNTLDATLRGANDELRRARDLAVQGVNGALGPQAREALATEVEQIRERMLAAGNTTYLGRPVFGGVTNRSVAYDSGTADWVGTPGSVNRTVADGIVVDVQVAGPKAFGPDGGNVFDHLEQLAADLRAGNIGNVQAHVGALNADMDRVTGALADVGTRAARIEQAVQRAKDAELDLTSSLSEVENTDLPKAIVELQMQEVAYQAALAATSRVLQPSLVDFLR
ncbi:flagellar hook-associated protein FlgL [Nocardioides sp. GCM10027113]|uniref:flagellar hook-associated protein FlgL n=1 Tax=unclassified Nocardioides TaxID=2615069 RepID=UPI0036135FA7